MGLRKAENPARRIGGQGIREYSLRPACLARWWCARLTRDNDGMAQLRDIVIDCSHPASLARFWAAALDGYAVAPYDDEEIERLRSLGVTDLEDDPTVIVEGPGPRLFLQRVPEPKSGKNRVHLDLTAMDVEAEVQRLVGLGASVLDRYESHVTLADPQGNEICLTTN
jgi:hypothetical protein